MEFRGYNRVKNALRGLVVKSPQVADETLRAWAQDSRAELKSTPYPPVPAGSKYIRTGNLANRWAVVNLGVARYALVNRAPYSGWVVGEQQTQTHRQNKWWRASEILARRLDELRDRLRVAYTKLWRSGR